MARRIKKKAPSSEGHQKKVPSPNKSDGMGAVRIIAGQWRGRKLSVKNISGLRPTTDRVKETVFNWLSPYIFQADCLDMFAGSGNLGFEALSRQAKSVTFLELHPDAAKQIRNNLDVLRVNNAEIINTDANLYLSTPSKTFDLVFIDPPFRQHLINDVIIKLEQHMWLNNDALIYIETEKELRLPTTPPHWQLLREKHAGQVSFRLYQRG